MMGYVLRVSQSRKLPLMHADPLKFSYQSFMRVLSHVSSGIHGREKTYMP